MAKIIDIREEFEFKNLPAFKEALKYPMSSFPDWVANLDKNETYYIICRSGSRSKRITQKLRQLGFNAHNYEGGMLKAKDI